MKYMSTAIVLAAAASTAASAGFVDMVYTGNGAGMEVQLHLDGGSRDLFVGEIMHMISGGTGPDAILNGAMVTFCPDITQIVATSLTSYEVTDIENIPQAGMGISPMGSAKADAIRSLYSSAQSTLMAGSLSNAYATAFQLTIWEIVSDYDGTAASINVDTGSVIVTDTSGLSLSMDVLNHISALTSAMMTEGANGGGAFTDVIGLANEGRQDQLVLVPAPGAFALMGMGGLIATRRRRS